VIRLNTALRTLAILAVAASLSACVSLFPKAKPATMYRFGTAAIAAPAGQPKGAMFGVLHAPTGFARSAATDQILTTTNGEVAYIADARWISPAVVLFDEAVQRAFSGDQGPARLVSRGEASKSDFVLKLDVRTFEAQYTHGSGAAPDVVVAVRAVMTRNSDRSLVGDHTFEARVPANDNRVSAIVPAYDAAVTQVLSDLLLWVNAGGTAPVGK
jgi:cholesterol transport system auxiliary component